MDSVSRAGFKTPEEVRTSIKLQKLATRRRVETGKKKQAGDGRAKNLCINSAWFYSLGFEGSANTRVTVNQDRESL